MLPDLVESIKRAALDAVKNSDPTALLYGKVISIEPLEIKINVKLILTKSFLKLTKAVTDYETTITIDGEEKTVTIHNALAVGDKVILIRQAGGQEYTVMDKVG